MSTWRLVRSTPAEYKERTRADAQFYSGGWSTRTRRLLTASSSENRGAALLLMMIARHTSGERKSLLVLRGVMVYDVSNSLLEMKSVEVKLYFYSEPSNESGDLYPS